MREWTCICGSRVFVLTGLKSILVDFSKEGAINGHPYLTGVTTGKSVLVCNSCHTKIPYVAASEMLKEII